MNSLAAIRILCAMILLEASLVTDGGPVLADAPWTRLRQETSDLLRQEATATDGAEKEAAVAALCDLFVVIRSNEQYSTSGMLQGDAAKIRHRLLSIARSRAVQLKRDNIERPADLSASVETAITTALADQATVGQLLQPSPAGGHGGGAAVDGGWELVELIERIVAPDFWEPVGGPGTIRATSDVHEQIKDLLTALR
jgi:hypothetical protein